MIYREHWAKKNSNSLFSYTRDFFINLFPIQRLPYFIRKNIYGIDPKFIFIVHPRRKEDIFIALPFFRILRYALPKRLRYKIISLFPPFVLSEIRTCDGTNGLVVSSLMLPEILMSNKHLALVEARRCLKFSAKIADKNAVVGLGAWWPIVTRRGLALREYSRKLEVVVTNGHCGTLCSLYLMSKKIISISNMNLKDVKLLIIGSGKMGTNIAKVLNGEVKEITLLDSNVIRLHRAEQILKASKLQSQIKTLMPSDGNNAIKKELANHHFCIGTTSNLRRIVKPHDLPENIIVIDDSRPEAFPRIFDKYRKIVVVEGGLMKIKKIKLFYNFGFGIDENVFGCLAESYILVKDKFKALIPTLGDVQLENFQNMLVAFREHNVEVGDFKTSDIIIDNDIISNIINSKGG